jgi:hypothetical protein
MKYILSIALSAVLLTALTGCQTQPPTDRSSLDAMQERAKAITDAGGIATVGVGNARDIGLALDKAQNIGRQQLAVTLSSKIDALGRSFQEEIGAGKAAEFKNMFSTASKILVSQHLKDNIAKDVNYKTKEGETQAYALMVLDPKIIPDAFTAQAKTQRRLYTRFRASQAFSDMDKALEQYEKWKKKDGASIVK